MTAERPEILFLCVHNAGRSQMAAGLLRRAAGELVGVRSAGSEPADQLNPAVVEAMAEVGIELTGQSPRKLTYGDAEGADIVITMGCGDACPVFPGKRYIDWPVLDPAGLSLNRVRPIRDEIQGLVDGLCIELGIVGR